MSKVQKRRRAQDLRDLGEVASTPAGKRLLLRLLESAGVFRSSFAGADTHATAFNEGRRNVGLMWMAEIEQASPLTMPSIVGLMGKATVEDKEGEDDVTE